MIIGTPTEKNPYCIGDRVAYIHPLAGTGIRMPHGSLATVTRIRTSQNVVICFDEATSDKYRTWGCDIEYLEPASLVDVDVATLL